MFRKSSTPWSSISDIMAGLMMVFLFISVSYAYQVAEQAAVLKEQSEQLANQNEAQYNSQGQPRQNIDRNTSN